MLCRFAFGRTGVENHAVRADPLAEGENRFVAELKRLFGSSTPSAMVGIGDDAAVLPGKPVRVISVDLLVEKQHFRWDLMEPADVAVRALEVNLSDIAAMGARPEAVFLGLAWPSSGTARARLANFLRSFRAACKRRGVPLLGGDTVHADDGATTLAVTVVGTPWPGGPVLRSTGRPGDWLCVTGSLGGASLGLAVVESRVRVARSPAARRAAAIAIRRLRRPRALLDAARVLARGASALIDLSDGLGLDAPRLAGASACGFRIDLSAIPIDPAVCRLVPDPAEALRHAIHGGDDYQLLAAVPSRRFAAVHASLRRRGITLHRIGRLTPQPDLYLLSDSDGHLRPWPERGWDPFRPLDASRGVGVGRGAPKDRTRR